MPRCKLADCPIARDGRCLEGRPNDCPNLLRDEVPKSPESHPGEASQSTQPSPSRTEQLYTGLALEIEEAREFSRRGTAIVVALAGMIETGKTSLIARLHQMFQEGRITDYDYAESRTLPRFEELNWKATVESGVAVPEMDHSSLQGDNSFLHFAVQERIDAANRIDLLINDISGETFPLAVAEENVCNKLLCLRAADHLALLIDSAALAHQKDRHDHCAKVRNFAERVLHTGQIGKQTALHLIISRLDLLKTPHDPLGGTTAADGLEANFSDRFRPLVASVQCWRLAARPMDGTLPSYDVINKLFAVWVQSVHRNAARLAAPSTTQAFARDFCRFGS